MTKVLISIVGPTAIGKTALSIQLAKHFETEIISADSRQFYKEMQIGTAVPSPEELNAAIHHFVQHKSIKDTYNVGDFERDAISKLEALFKTRPVVIMVGGSGLYNDAVTRGLDYFPEIDSNIRVTLNKRLIDDGIEALQKQLEVLDPKAFKTIAINNPHRLIRALEVCIGTNKPYTSFLSNSTKTRNFKTICIGLDAERSLIYDRINTRVDTMLKQGLLNEVKSLYPYRSLNALNTVGYKELFAYLDGAITLEFACSEIKKHTRRFAKRQLTWFKRNKNTIWFNSKTELGQIIEAINDYMK